MHFHPDAFPGGGRLLSLGEPSPGSCFQPILLYLPPGYGTNGRRYPVVYGQDGASLLAPRGPGNGWNAGAYLDALAWQGLETIVVGVGIDPRWRVEAYSPCADAQLGGGSGDHYLDFLTGWLKPRIDANLLTLADPEHTAIVGASLGGLISMYAFFRRPDVFGRAAALSPSVHFADGAAWSFVETCRRKGGRLYVDAGTMEFGRTRSGGPSTASHRYLDGVRQLRGRIEHRGYRAGHDLGYLEAEGESHCETSWGRRFPGALSFLMQ